MKRALSVITVVGGFIFLFLIAPKPAEAAIQYAGGWYTNLCGNGTADAYNCSANCDPHQGRCTGSYVYKFTCGGQHWECVANGTGPSSSQSFDTGISNQTQQIDVFNKNCGNISDGNWQCLSGNDLEGFMVWYHPQTCQNSCSSTSDPKKPKNPSPSNGAILNSYNINFSWTHSGWGSCGGNNCSNSSCNSVTRSNNRYRLYVDGALVYQGNSKSHSMTVSGQYHSWYVVARSNCRSRTSNVWTFTVNRPPTADAQIVSNMMCNGDPSTAGLSGIHALKSGDQDPGINNPLQVSAQYTDPDGVNTLNKLSVWFGGVGKDPSKTSDNQFSAQATVKVNSGNSYSLLIDNNTTEQISIGNGRGICTIGGNNRTEFCNIASPPAGAVAYAYPKAFNKQGNTITVSWELGLLGNSTFPLNNRLYVFAEDKPQANSGWQNEAGWQVDLNPPVVDAEVQIRNHIAFDVITSANDTTTSVISSGRSCTSQLANNDSVTISQVVPAVADNTKTFTGVETKQVCMDNSLGEANFTVSSVPRNGGITFDISATDRACNTGVASDSLVLKTPWLMTTDGDLFSSLGISQTTIADIIRIISPNLPDQNGMTPYLSDYNFMIESGALPAQDTELDFAVDGYDDLNGKPREELGFDTWYDLIEAQIQRELAATQIATVQGDRTFSDVTTQQISQAVGMGGVQVNGFSATEAKDKVNVIKINGSLNLNRITCNTKTIFVVSGNLVLNPELLIDDNPLADIVNGCMYVVQNSTTVLPGQDADVLGTNTVRPEVSNNVLGITATPTPPPIDRDPTYDTVDGFILTGSITSEFDSKYDGLRVVGAIIALQNNNFQRDLGIVLNQLSPAEIIYYDGGRYMHLFGDILYTPVNFNIVEKPFIESFE